MLELFQKKGFDKANIRGFFGKEGIEERYIKNVYVNFVDKFSDAFGNS